MSVTKAHRGITALTAAIRELGDAASKAQRPRGAGAGGGGRTLADELRRNTPEMDEFINELRRRGLLKG